MAFRPRLGFLFYSAMPLASVMCRRNHIASTLPDLCAPCLTFDNSPKAVSPDTSSWVYYQRRHTRCCGRERKGKLPLGWLVVKSFHASSFLFPGLLRTHPLDALGTAVGNEQRPASLRNRAPCCESNDRRFKEKKELPCLLVLPADGLP